MKGVEDESSFDVFEFFVGSLFECVMDYNYGHLGLARKETKVLFENHAFHSRHNVSTTAIRPVSVQPPHIKKHQRYHDPSHPKLDTQCLNPASNVKSSHLSKQFQFPPTMLKYENCMKKKQNHSEESFSVPQQPNEPFKF